MNAFITGSHAYGQPRPDSDVDLVVLITEKDKQLLESLKDPGHESIRFGKLNLIPTTNKKQYFAWKEATEEMVEDTNFGLFHNREEAKKKIIAALEKAGEKDQGGSD